MEAHSLQGMQRYMAPNESITKDPKDLLNRRIAVGVLKVTSMHDFYVIVVSVHNYSGHRSGRDAPVNYACLLFEFLSKLSHILLERGLHFTVVIAGDFNLDITKDQSLSKYLAQGSYDVPEYCLRPLRQDLKCIDFIVVSKQPLFPKYYTQVKDVQAHDLQNRIGPGLEITPLAMSATIEEQRKITNHSPLSATIEVKKYA